MSNLSAGVQILIAQLKENPEQFFGEFYTDARYVATNPKFSGWRQIIEEELVGVEYHSERLKKRLTYTWFMSEEEKEALADAYLEAKRQRFDAELVYLLNAQPEADRIYPRTSSPYVANPAKSLIATTHATGPDIASYSNAMGTAQGSSV